MAEVKVTVFNDGPYELVGPLTVVDEEGNPLDIEAGEPVYLCRCGGSASKPFCDGSHDGIGFQSKIVCERSA